MIASPRPFLSMPLERLQAQLETVLPRIERHARVVFHHVRCAFRKADCIAETVALCWQWFVRLAEKGRDATRFVSTLASFAASAVKSRRRLIGQEKAKDVLSPRAQQVHDFSVEYLPQTTQTAQENLYAMPHGQEMLDAFEERLHDNCLTPVPDQVAFRIDWPNFFQTLAERDRRLATFLALGHSAKKAAQRFHLSPGRVTQLRQQWFREWRAFQGEAE